MCKPSSTTLHDYQEISFVTLKIVTEFQWVTPMAAPNAHGVGRKD